MQLENKDLRRLRWYLGQMLALLSLWTVGGLDMARGPVWVAVTLLCVAVIIFPKLIGTIPLAVKRLLVPILLLGILWDFFTSGQDVIPPLIRLLLLLLAIRIFSYRSTREDMQLVLIAMFLSMVSGVFTLSMLFALQATLFAMGTIALLFLINLLECQEENTTGTVHFDGFRRRLFLKKIIRATDARLLRGVVVVFVLLLSFTGILFVSIPRLHLEQAVPFLRLPQASLSGFSDVVRFGEVTNISEDNSPALRIDVPSREAIPSNPYWRMLVLDRYDSGAFINSMVQESPSRASLTDSAEIRPYDALSFRGDDVASGAWTFYLEGGISRYLPILGPFAEMRFQGRQRLSSNPQVSVFYLPETSNSVFFYRVTDFLIRDYLPGSSLDEPLLSILSGEETLEGRSGSELRTYPYSTLALPVSTSEVEYLQELLASILPEDTGGQSPEEVARAIESFLNTNHSYSLRSTLAGDGDPVVQWLRQGSAGHCELFAGAFTLLARTAGIPTRIVVGFSGGAWNSYEDYFVVRNRNAHAWCEYFDGENWVRIDPTPGSSSGSGRAFGGEAGMAGFGFESGFQAWVDSLRVIWYRRVINFDEDSQVAMTEGLAARAKAITEAVSANIKAHWERGKALFRDLLDLFREKFYLTSITVILILLTAYVCLRILLKFSTSLRYRFFVWGDRMHPLRARAGKELQKLSALEINSTADSSVEFPVKVVEEGLLEVRFGPRLDKKTAIRWFEHSKKIRKKSLSRKKSAIARMHSVKRQ